MKSNTKKGSTIIELALVLPFFMMVILGFYEIFSRGHAKQAEIIQAQDGLWIDLLK